MSRTRPGYIDPTPWAPMYPPAPHDFVGCWTVQMLCRAPKGVLASILPPGLTLVDDLYRLNWSHTDDIEGYPNIDLAEIVVPVEFQGRRGIHTLIEYVDDEYAMVVGREAFGWPKKLAEIVREDRADGSIRFAAVRRGETIVEAEFVPAPEAAPGLETDAFGGPDAATYSVRRIAATDNAPGYAEIHDFSFPEYRPTAEPEFGSATVTLHDGSWGDPLSFLSPVEVLGARYDRHEGTVFDFGTQVGTVPLA